MNREEHESYQRRIDHLEAQNKQFLDQLMKYDLVTPRVIHIDNVSKDSINKILQQENIQLKSDLQESNKEIEMLKDLNERFRSSMVNGYDTVKQLKSELQALRELLQEVEFSDDGCCFFCYEGSYEGHKDTCKLKAELDKIKAV